METFQRGKNYLWGQHTSFFSNKTQGCTRQQNSAHFKGAGQNYPPQSSTSVPSKPTPSAFGTHPIIYMHPESIQQQSLYLYKIQMSSYTEETHVFSSYGKVGMWKSTNHTFLFDDEVSNLGLDPQKAAFDIRCKPQRLSDFSNCASTS